MTAPTLPPEQLEAVNALLEALTSQRNDAMNALAQANASLRIATDKGKALEQEITVLKDRIAELQPPPPAVAAAAAAA